MFRSLGVFNFLADSYLIYSSSALAGKFTRLLMSEEAADGKIPF